MDDTPPSKSGTSIQTTALDGILNVNSLFTLGVFIGLTWQPADITNTLIDDPNCVADSKVAKDLFAYQVYSFSSFLFSSLVALALKQAVRISKTARSRTILTHDLAHINRNALRVGYMLSAAGSVSGSVFLVLSLVNVVQIKLGTLACGSSHSYGAVVPLLIFVPSALLIYWSCQLFIQCSEEMEAPMKYIWVLGFLVFLGIAGFNGVDGAGECGKSSPDAEAFKLVPCASAAQDENAAVSKNCCVQVKKLGQNPSCLCAVMLSNTAKSSGVKPEVAITIPKRCNIADRPVGYKCGDYTLP
ncbi:hypothetical protein F0562_026357 [Nyssa sinensis]|uniref:Bifunctional inhibitor/plant lipid transfer protein/seed storage helical domain-containing protein n=1 Tax=Nyssa sinensis TaxID=561372 RepID=A0A5J5BAI5_9ASTE|nr:hypothetical protein F0562_026357 [Nyssa sinensis]